MTPDPAFRRAAALLSLASVTLLRQSDAASRALGVRCMDAARELREKLGPAPLASGDARG